LRQDSVASTVRRYYGHGSPVYREGFEAGGFSGLWAWTLFQRPPVKARLNHAERLVRRGLKVGFGVRFDQTFPVMVRLRCFL
jgi:hypothetical protein